MLILGLSGLLVILLLILFVYCQYLLIKFIIKKGTYEGIMQAYKEIKEIDKSSN